MLENDAQTGVLLINIGTPVSPGSRDVRRYLREFLSDPHVIDIHPMARWLLLNLIILPFRPKTSGAAYRKVWMKEGSPLLVYSEAFTKALGESLGDRYKVMLGMRYGTPSLEGAIDEMIESGVTRIVVFPLFPQYAASSTGTALQAVYGHLSRRWNVRDVSTVAPFYKDPGLAQAVAEVGTPILESVKPERILFSFHGLPERHIHKSDETSSHCLASDNCCATIHQANQYCYRAQCYATARLTAQTLGLSDSIWSVAFQSRLGRTPWIKPYTNEVIVEMAQQGIKRLVIFCPAFVADCLETLEEIGIRAPEDFIAHGGEELVLVPAVNDHPVWVQSAADQVRQLTGEPTPSRSSLL